jgi:hypothetical protein
MLQEILEEREDAVVDAWLDCVLSAYPADGGAVFKRRTNQFANPVGHTSREAVRVLYRALVADAPDTLYTADLGELLRVRAVQQMPPSEAVGWVLELKTIVREELTAWWSSEVREALRAFERRIDDLALEAFDRYVAFREELAELKIKEARRHVSWIVDRLNGAAAGESGEAEDAVSLPIVEDNRVRGGVSR